MANLYTKTGDKGETSLVGGMRVSKASLRVDCYGTIDEANSMLGLAYSQSENDKVRTAVRKIQGRLFALGAELASDEKTAASLTGRISEQDIAFLEEIVDSCTLVVGKQTAFVIPGVNQASATLHVARTIVRRAERNIINLSQQENVEAVLLKYVNRLSDAIYAMARLTEEEAKENNMREKVTKLVLEAFNQQSNNTPQLNLDTARIMAKRAIEKANQLNLAVIFSVVDKGGNLILLERMEEALLGSIEISIGKAYTANAFKMPTHKLGEASQPNQALYGIENANPGKIILFGGGFPYIINGTVVGGVGVSGASVEEDMEIARYAMSFEGGNLNEY